MWANVAVEALQRGVVLELRYDGYSRWVEVHAIGYSKTGHGLMRCWQIGGGSVSNEPVGWKLMRLDAAGFPQLTEDRSAAPRSGYKRGDRDMARIVAQL